MPPGIKAPQIPLSVKPGLGCLNTGTLNCLTAHRRTPSRLQAAAVPMHPWSLCNKCSSSSTPSLAQGVKLPVFGAAPHDLKQPATQAKPDSVWHAVDLQEDSTPHVPSTTDPAKAAAQAFQVQSLQQLQDVFNCLVLAETVYKVQDGNHAEVATTVAALRQDFPAPLVTLQRLQWSLPHVPHRYLLAESEEALYVAFIGTKQRRDIMTNANIMQQPLWPDSPASSSAQDVPAAHTGFLTRAQGVAIQSLYQQATRSNKRLVLTGHSLGGAVALLCTLNLLHALGDEANPRLACVGFATPAVGNAALADHTKAKGWDSFITNYLVPEDVIARLIPPQVATATAEAAGQVAEHEQVSSPAHPALWAPLAQPLQPPFRPSPHPAPPNLLAPSHQDGAAEEPLAPFCTTSSSLGDVGQLQAAAPVGRPSLPPRFRGAHGAWHAHRYNSTPGGSKQLAQQTKLSAVGNVQLPPLVSAVGSDRQSTPTLRSNIVPLRGLARGHNGSKRMYNSLFDNSRFAASVQHDSRQAACSPCKSTAQDFDSSGGDMEGSEKQNRWQQQQQQQQEQQNAPTTPGTGLWMQSSRLARLVSFPVRVTRAYHSYVPLGQQLYLNPQSVTAFMQNPHQSLGNHATSTGFSSSTPDTAAAATETASATSAVPAAVAVSPASRVAASEQPAAASVSDAVTDVVDSVVRQRREQLGRLWMHRMPTYRARFQQILFTALGQAVPALVPQAPPAKAQSGRQSRPIAPEIHVRQAQACAGHLLASHHLKDMLQGSVSAVAEQSSFRWFWIWSGVWPAIRSRLRQKQQDITLQIAVRGQGIQHVNSTQATLDKEELISRIVNQSHTLGLGMSFHAENPGSNWVQAALAVLLGNHPVREMVVEVVVPARLAQKARLQLASTGGLKLTITVQSDFCSACAPVIFTSDTQALQDSLSGMIAFCKLVTAVLLKKSAV